MDHLENKLNKRREEDSFRTLKNNNPNLRDFSSNDYLGLARSTELKRLILDAYQKEDYPNGSTGSRLITGNQDITEQTESFLAQVFNTESTLVFNSGYMANMALFSSIPQRGDTIVYDELSHACIKDGCRLSMAKRLPFLHNNLDDLKKKLAQSEGQVYVACESVYSMDGDMAPLQEIATICKETGARLIVDEAHSTGLWGKDGSGLINDLMLSEEVFAVVYTFGKGMGIHGAAIATSKIAREFMINFSRPFIYTTAPSAFELISIKTAFEFLQTHPSLQLNIQSKIELFNGLQPRHSSPSAIKSIEIGGNRETRLAAEKLQASGFDVRPILSPTVKEGTERLRICLHTFNTEEEIVLLCDQLKALT